MKAKNLYSIAVNIHDHNSYDGTLHYQAERHTRKKHNLNVDNHNDATLSRSFFKNFFIPNFSSSDYDLFCFTCSRLGQMFTVDLIEKTLGKIDFLKFKPTNLWDNYRTDNFYYIDHHQSHAAYAYLMSGYKESDILAIDGRGWNFTCVFITKNGEIKDLTDRLSIGSLWNRISQIVGFGYLSAGKLMGLAGYGKFDSDVFEFIKKWTRDSELWSSDDIKKTLKGLKTEDIAYTLQLASQELIKDQVYPLKTCKNICVAGGVAYNGYVNEMLNDYYDKVFVPAAPGDEGQSIGTYMHADYVLNGNIHIPQTYAGYEYTVDPNIFKGLHYKQQSIDEVCIETAHAIANGEIVGWYHGRSESGNRALGNRSILADPRNPYIKDIINNNIKKREDFRPFAPAVLEEYYQDYFDTDQPSPYMSRIVPVKSNKIPGVTHVDGTARIQTVSEISNKIFYKVIEEFRKLTGVPVLLNTSFNCQEPIVETPQEAVNTFLKTDLDLLVIDNYIIRKLDD